MYLMCSNSKCKNYFEDSCLKNLGGERIELNSEGKCDTFEAGENEVYQMFNEQKENGKF